jgi:putative aldouronate transport system substrate-binding protein
MSMVLGVLVAEAATKKEEPVKLLLVMYGDAGTRNMEFYENEFHDKIMEDLNIDIKIEYTPWGSSNQIATRLASGERFAFMCIFSDSMEWVRRGLMSAFDEEMINEVAPDYLDARMDNGFEFTSYKGDIYTIPLGSSMFSGPQDNFTIRNDILNKVGWDYTKINSYEDLMDAIAAVHAEFPDLCIVGQINFLAKALSSVYAPDALLKPDNITNMVTVDESKPDSDEVISWYESEYFKNLCKLLEEWYDLGYLDMEHLVDGHVNEWNTGNALMYFGAAHHIYKHISDSIENADFRYVKISEDQPRVILRNYDWGWAVSAADQDNVKNWMRFFN